MRIPKTLYQEICKVIPLVHADVVVIHKGEVLLLKRVIDPAKGEWCLPGGGIELGETPREAAVRELEEETGIVVPQKDLVGEKVVNWFHPDRQDITVTYTIRSSKTDVVLNEEHDEYVWVRYSGELPEPISAVTIEQILWAINNKEVKNGN